MHDRLCAQTSERTDTENGTLREMAAFLFEKIDHPGKRICKEGEIEQIHSVTHRGFAPYRRSIGDPRPAWAR